jgi:hypothetical protein
MSLVTVFCFRFPVAGDDVGHGRPEPTRVGVRQFETRVADGLTGETAGHNVRSWPGSGVPPWRECGDVVMAGNLRPVSGQDVPAERIDLHLAGEAHSGAL